MTEEQELTTYCWCGKTTKPLPAPMIRRGETFECSLKCRAMFDEHGFRPSWTALGGSKYHHGTYDRFLDGCRCGVCRKAASDYQRARSS